MLVFLIMQLLPGDPARIMLGSEATQEQIDLLRQEMGLDQPLALQCAHWLGDVLHFVSNSGISVPSFWLAILGLYLFSLKLGWLPVQGYISPREDLSQSVKPMLMPVIRCYLSELISLAKNSLSKGIPLAELETIDVPVVDASWRLPHLYRGAAMTPVSKHQIFTYVNIS